MNETQTQTVNRKEAVKQETQGLLDKAPSLERLLRMMSIFEQYLKEMTTELRRLKGTYWLRRNCTAGQLQIARATADHGHTGQSKIERSYISEKSNHCLGRPSQQRQPLLISTSFIDTEPFVIFFSRHRAVILLSKMVQSHVPLTTSTDSNLRTDYDSANPCLISSSFLSSKGRRETETETEREREGIRKVTWLQRVYLCFYR